jgi:hypothetical protein
MCGGQHGRHGFRGGFRFGGGGFPNREEWLERLQVYREQLEQELENVRELIERLGDGGQTAAPEI